MKKRFYSIAILLYAAVLYTAETFLPRLIWHIPFGDVDIPIAFWSILLIYSFIFIKRPLPAVAATGIGLNLIYTFIQTELYRRSSGYAFEASIYGLYYYLVYYSAAPVISLLAAYALRKVFIEDGGESYTEYAAAPFLAVIIVSLAALPKVTLAIPITFVIFIGIFTAIPKTVRLTERAKEFYKSVARWMLNHEKPTLLLFFIVAVAIRMLYLARTMTDPNYLLTGADGVLYDSYAWKIARNEQVLQAYAAGYWIFLGGIYKVLGHNYVAACFVQIILGSLSCLFIYGIIKEITDNKLVAYGGLFLACINYSLIFSAISIGHQALDCFLLPLIVLMIIYLLKGTIPVCRKIFIVVITALASGYSVVTRESNLLIVTAIPLFIIIDSFYKKRIIAGARNACLFVIIFTLPVLPFAMRNAGNLGVLYPLGHSKSENIKMEEFFSYDNERLMALGINPLKGPVESFRNAVKAPKETMQALGDSVRSKFTQLFLNQEYGKFDILLLIRHSPFYMIAWFYAFLITILGIFKTAFGLDEKNRLSRYFLLSVIFLKTLPHLLIVSRFAFRAPIDPFLIVVFLIGAVNLFSFNGRGTA